MPTSPPALPIRSASGLFRIAAAAAAAACGDQGGAPAPAGDAGVQDEFPSCAGGGDGAGLSDALGPGRARAGRIAAAAELVGGDSRDGRVGDFKLENERVAFVVQDVRLGDNYIPYGGALIDGDLRRAPGEPGHDGIDEYATAFFLNPFEAAEVCVLGDGSDGGPAVVRAVGFDSTLPIASEFLPADSVWGLQVAQDFILEPGANHLQIVTTARLRGAGSEPKIATGDFILMSDDGFDPWIQGPGFERIRHAAERELSLLGVAGEDRHLVYGFFSDAPLQPDAVVTPIIQGKSPSDMSIFFPKATLSYVRDTATVFRRYLAIGRDIDEVNRARHEKQGVTGLGTIAGTVTADGAPVAGARVHVLDSSAQPPAYVTMARTDGAGMFQAEVPAGAYRVVATGRDIGQDVKIPGELPPEPPFAHGYVKSVPVEVAVAAGGEARADLSMGPPGRLSVRIVDDSSGAAIAGKAIVRHACRPKKCCGKPRPLDPILGERRPFPDADHVLWTADGEIEADLEPGCYQVVGASGFEYETASEAVEILPGGRASVALRLARAVERPGWLAGDLHMHAGPSIHGECTREMRVVTNVAEGLDFFASSDHDRVVDYRPEIERLGLSERLDNIVSNEISPLARFHINPYPLVPVPDEPNAGATPWWEVTAPCAIFQHARDRGAALIQINHGTGRGGYFDSLQFDWRTGEAGSADFCLDFDAMETVNGTSRPDMEARLRVYAGLLHLGKAAIPTGVSDSHHRLPPAGVGRTYLRTGAAPGALDDDAFVAAMRARGTVVSIGPFIDLVVTAPGGTEAVPGEDLEIDAGEVSVAVRVLAPSWIPVERVQIVTAETCPDENGECAAAFTWGDLIGAGGQEGEGEGESESESESEGEDPPDAVVPIEPGVPPVWLDAVHSLRVDRDTWILVRADGLSDLGPVYPGATPFAHTAAVRIFVR